MRKLSTCRHASVKLGHFCAGFLFGISTGLIKVALHEGQNTQQSNATPIHAEADFTKIIRKLTGTNTKLELKNTRVMCIFYKKRTVNLLHQLRIARRSWTNKCTSMLVFIDSYNRTIPAVSFDRLPDWVKISQSKLITGLRYVFGNHFHDADWFFISRGIPYVIMENLRHFLSNQDNNNAVYWGHKLKRRTFVKEVIYPDDFAGIALSKQALYRLGTRGQYKRVCNEVDTTEGIMFSMCMAGLGIRFGDTRDGENKSRLLLYSPGSYLDDNLPVTPWLEDLELGLSRGHLTFYSTHTYDNKTLFDDWAPFLHNASEYQLDKPLVIAEFNQVRGAGMTSQDQFKWSYFHGYDGAWSWYAMAQSSPTDTLATQMLGMESIKAETDEKAGGLVAFSLT